MPVKIVTDSTSDISPELANALGITVVPVYVRFGDEVYKDGIDISNDNFYEKLLSSSIHSMIILLWIVLGIGTSYFLLKNQYRLEEICVLGLICGFIPLIIFGLFAIVYCSIWFAEILFEHTIKKVSHDNEPDLEKTTKKVPRS